MRYLINLASLILIATTLHSCQKEFEEPGAPLINTNVDFKAKINGVPFIAAIYGASIRTTDNVISLAGKSNDGQQLAFTIVDSGVHVYSLGFNSFSNFAAYGSATNVFFTTNAGITEAESGGNIAIVTLDTVRRVMSGTFNFKAYHEPSGPQRIITEGIFNNIPY